MKRCIIAIPIYKKIPTTVEEASFRQGLNILGNHDIVVFTFRELDISIYKSIAVEVGKNFSVEYFDKHFFASVQGYNDLCFSTEFYERFTVYEYMLIYQLDAWVFRDELDYWCDQGYDYIGAPIFHAYNARKFTTKFCGIGNGGFCLRRISHCLNMLKSNRNKNFIKPFPLVQLYWNYFLYSDKFTRNFVNRLRIVPTVILKMFGYCNSIDYYAKHHINEDMIFGTWSSKSWGFHGNIPSKEIAQRFSFEVHPDMLYKENGNVLPFGCHAFEKWSYDTFWKNYIKF